jgi:hypothetical protein
MSKSVVEITGFVTPACAATTAPESVQMFDAAADVILPVVERMVANAPPGLATFKSNSVVPPDPAVPL